MAVGRGSRAKTLALLALSLAASLLFTGRALAHSDVEVTAYTDQDVYEPGERVEITIRLVNGGEGPVTLHFSSSCQIGFEVRDGFGNNVYVAARHMVCLMVLTELTLQAGESRSYDQSWDQSDDSGHPVPPGSHLTVCGSALSYEKVREGRCAEIIITGGPPSSSGPSSTAPVPQDTIVISAVVAAVGGVGLIAAWKRGIVGGRRIRL